MKTPKSPYKELEFKKFIELLEEGTNSHWEEIAQALEIDKNTITSWKRTTQAQISIKKGIANALKEMKRVGKDDWRMWDRILERLGAKVITKTDLTTDGEKINEIIITRGYSDKIEKNE